jgi:hypothetical protein
MAPGKYILSENLNSDSFMCEGTAKTYSNGSSIWVDSSFTNHGKPELKLLCDFTPGYADNNLGTQSIDFAGENAASVLFPCTLNEVSPNKDCGFRLYNDNLMCEPGMTKSLFIEKKNRIVDEAVLIRICESSIELGHSVYCEVKDALANVLIVHDKMTKIDFTCPEFRDETEIGGRYSILVSSLVPGNIPEINLQF